MNQIIQQMVAACKKADLTVEVLEPAGKIKVNAADGNAHMAETVTLAPDKDGELMWWWSWGMPICPATQLDRAVALVSNVVAIPIF